MQFKLNDKLFKAVIISPERIRFKSGNYYITINRDLKTKEWVGRIDGRFKLIRSNSPILCAQECKPFLRTRR